MLRAALIGGLVLTVLSTITGASWRPNSFAWPITVIDEAEQTVADARVCAYVEGASGGAVPCAQSGAGGEFSIVINQPATYRVIPSKLELGYPSAESRFYGPPENKFPAVLIKEGSPAPDPVSIKLGPKAGRLVLTILDGASRKPIASGVIEVCRVGEPRSWWSMSTGWPKGHFELLTPDVPFTIKFKTRQGEWVDRIAFDDRGMPVDVIQVPMSERRELTVILN